MHRRTRKPPVTVTGGVKRDTPCIYHRKHRLIVRRKLLRAIVLGSDGPTGFPSRLPEELLEDQDDVTLVAKLEEAMLDPQPRPHTDVARVWLRYSFHVSDYFQSERIATIQQSLMDRVSNGWLDKPRCRSIWEDSLEPVIRKSYSRYVKTAALDFILSDGSPMSWKAKRDREALMSSSCPRQTERHKPMLVVQRSIGRKLCIHHFYGRKFVALWYRFIKYV